MIIIPIKHAKFKDFDALKLLAFNIKHSGYADISSINTTYTDNYISINRAGNNVLLVLKNNIINLGYSKDYTNKFIIFYGTEDIKRYIKNRIASLKLKIPKNVNGISYVNDTTLPTAAGNYGSSVDEYGFELLGTAHPPTFIDEII